MKKIIVVFDSLRFSESTLSYALYFSRVCNAGITAVFLEEPVHQPHVRGGILHERDATHLKSTVLKDVYVREKNLQRFEQACASEAVNYVIHHDKGNALYEILQESAFGDIVIINENETLNGDEEQSPTHFIKALLDEAHCPVIVVPDIYKPIDNVVLLYNGSPASVHAIRSYSYLFEELKSLPTSVVTVTDYSGIIPHQLLITEFMREHFPSADYVPLKGIPYQSVIEYLETMSENTLVIVGAYQRSKLSRAFRPSMADHLMSELQLPLFIAHNKA